MTPTPFEPETYTKSPNFMWLDADAAERILALKEKDDIIEVLRHMLSHGYIAITLDEDLPGRMIRVSPELYQYLKETIRRDNAVMPIKYDSGFYCFPKKA